MASAYFAPAVVTDECVRIVSLALGRGKANTVQVVGISAEYQCSASQGNRMTKKLRGLRGIYNTSNRSFCFEGQSVGKITKKFGEDAVKDLAQIILPKIQAILFRSRH